MANFYFNNVSTGNSNASTQANWWTDDAFTDQATSFPTTSDDVYVSSDITTGTLNCNNLYFLILGSSSTGSILYGPSLTVNVLGNGKCTDPFACGIGALSNGTQDGYTYGICSYLNNGDSCVNQNDFFRFNSSCGWYGEYYGYEDACYICEGGCDTYCGDCSNEYCIRSYNAFGCTDSNACNYNADATCDDGSCTYIIDECHNCADECICSNSCGCNTEYDNCDNCVTVGTGCYDTCELGICECTNSYGCGCNQDGSSIAPIDDCHDCAGECICPDAGCGCNTVNDDCGNCVSPDIACYAMYCQYGICGCEDYYYCGCNPDGSSIAPIDNCHDCSGNCICGTDCTGTCDGLCIGCDNFSTCCDDGTVDCDGVCNGGAVNDYCGTCNGTGQNDCDCNGYGYDNYGTCCYYGTIGCDGVCDSGAVEDNCFSCGGSCFECACGDCCYNCGGGYDYCGTCNGTGQNDCDCNGYGYDNYGTCCYYGTIGCDGVCDSGTGDAGCGCDTEIDNCGNCVPYNTGCYANYCQYGICGCEDLYGCGCNQDGSSIAPIDNCHDCSGNCICYVDCNNNCDGGDSYDNCNVCGGGFYGDCAGGFQDCTTADYDYFGNYCCSTDISPDFFGNNLCSGYSGTCSDTTDACDEDTTGCLYTSCNGNCTHRTPTLYPNCPQPSVNPTVLHAYKLGVLPIPSNNPAIKNRLLAEINNFPLILNVTNN
jgi:hypothetical protein